MSKFFKYLTLGYAVIRAIVSGEDEIKAIIAQYKSAKADGKITLPEAIGIIEKLIAYLSAIWPGFSNLL